MHYTAVTDHTSSMMKPTKHIKLSAQTSCIQEEVSLRLDYSKQPSVGEHVLIGVVVVKEVQTAFWLTGRTNKSLVKAQWGIKGLQCKPAGTSSKTKAF